MRVKVHSIASLALAAVMNTAHGQIPEINLLTDLVASFPPGCLSRALPDHPRSGQRLLVNQNIDVPSVHSDTRDATINVRVWRVACADEGFSTVLVRLRQVAGDAPVIVPHVLAGVSNFEAPRHESQLLRLPAAGKVGATGDIITVDGAVGPTWMLNVDPVSINGLTTFLPEDYNEEFTLGFTWYRFSADPTNVFFRIAGFDPELDLPQFDEPILNGRYSGQWVRAGAPRQGLVLQVAEQAGSNFVFAIFFTYLDGQPFWFVGNTSPALPQPGPVTIQMSALENGQFVANPNQQQADEVLVNPAGSIEIEVIDCNRIRVHYDLSPMGEGTGTMELDRLVRIAGYDCNPWQ